MAKQLNVNLAFSADTGKVKTQLQDLQNQLNKLTLSSKTQLGITKEIEDASRAAAELSIHLKNATNQQTGTLDFSKLNQSIKQSGTSLQQYGRTLQSLGPQGQQAFMSLAQAVANSEVPIRRTNAMLKEMGTALANTARWQLSSSILHGFMGAVQSAYGYAQDLNESLNNIRIVTGQNIDQMAKFAEEANKAARALSATTTEYTNASLIYYQQGLNDQQVKERTDITIKMANVARQSSEVVSDQMTAVWNNFYNGSKSLEHYADVMTALGAATASSTDEISEGLNKFAAAANTVGLSYEYAASALATVTATTRQSADVVGTAFKTLFARIQDLELGKTLDDGTTLGSYSQALAKVGVQIQDTSGEMKAMDAILEEMAAKWDTLGKAEQIALAQSVAGVRQYTQLIALMDNWDFMKQNLATANASSGALQKQADIYAESWEAAADRVTAAAENIYKALINDEFFIDLLNGVEKVIAFVDHLIDNLNGLKGVLAAIGAIVTKVFAGQISQGLTNIAYNLKMMTEKGRQAEKEARKKFIDDAVKGVAPRKEYTTDVEKAQQQSMRSQLELQQQYMENVDRMNAVEAEVNKKMMDRVSILRQQVIEAEKRKETASKAIDDASYGIITDIAVYNKTHEKEKGYIPASYNQVYAENIKPMKELVQLQVKIESGAKTVYDAIRTGSDSAEKAIAELNKQVQASGEIPDEVKQIFASLNADQDEVEAAVRVLNQELGKAIGEYSGEIKNVIGPDAAKKVDQYVAAIRDKTRAELDSAEAAKQAEAAQRKTSESIKKATGAQKGWADILVESANLAFSVASAFQMLGSAVETMMNPDVSGWEKFLTILTTLSMIIPTVTSIYRTFKQLLSTETVAKLANVAATIAQVGAEKALNQEKGQSRTKTKKNIQETNEDTKQKLRDVWKKNAVADWDKADEATQRGYIEKYLEANSYQRGPTTQKGGIATWHKKGSTARGAQTAADIAKSDPKVLQGAKGMFSKAGSASLTGVATSVGFIATGVAVIAGGIAWGVHQAHKAERAVEKARESVKGLQEQLDTVSNAYSEFSNTVNTFRSAEDGLKNLTKGTQEYQQSVYEANQAAMALLETNKNLSYDIVDGRITFNEGELDQALANQRDAATRAQAAKYAGDAELMRAEENLAKRNLSRDLHSKADVGQKAGNILGAAGTGLLGGTGIGAGIGTAVGGWAMGAGTVIGAIIGAFAGLVSGVITGVTTNSTIGTAVDYEGQALDKIAKAYEQDSSFIAKEGAELEAYFRDELKIDDVDLVSSLANNKEELQNLAEQMRQNAALVDAQNDLIASQLLADNSVVTSSEYQDAIIDKSGDVYDQLLQDALNSEGTKNWGKTGISQTTGVNEEAQEVFDDYLRYAGLEGKGYKLVNTTGNDDNRKFVYLDENGEEKQVALSTMQYAKATYEATNQMDVVGRELANAFAEWGAKEDAASQAMLSFLTTDTFDNATENEYNEISKAVDEAGGVEQYLTKTLGDLEAAAEKYGHDSAEELINAFTVALANGSATWDDIDLPHLNDAVKKNITISTAQQIENLIRAMDAGPLGEEAGKQFSEGLNTILAGMDLEDKEEALRRIAEIDWSSYNAAYQVKDIIEELGYEVNMTNAEFETWNQTMNAANQAYIDYGALLEKLKEIKGIVSDLNVGDIISKEDLERLVKYNEELAKYFRTLGTGEGQLIGDPLDLLQKVEELEKTELKDAISETQKALQIAEQQQAVNDKAKQYGGADYLKGKATYDTTETKTIQNDPNAGHYILGFLSSMGNAFANSQSAGYGPYVHDPGIEANAKERAGTTEVSTTTTHVDTDHYRKQLEFLNAYGYDTSKFTNADNNPTVANAEAVSAAINDVLERNPSITAEGLEQLQANILGSQIDYIMTANSAEERQAMLDSGEVSENAFGIAAMQAHTEEKWEGMDPEEIEEYADALMDAAENSELLFDNMSEEAAEDVALYTKKMNQGIEKLSDNIKDWSSILDKSDSSSEEYAEAMSDMKDAMSDVLGVSEDFLSDDFILKNMEDIKLAANGNAEAIDRLAIAASRDILLNVNIQDENVLNEILTLHDALAMQIPDIEVGATINSGEFLTKAAQIVEAANMTVEQANAYFRSMGFEPNFAVTTATVTRTPQGTKTTRVIDDWAEAYDTNGNIIGAYPSVITETTESVPMEPVEEEVQIPALTTDGGKPNFTLTRTNAGSMNNTSSKNSGGKSGSGSKPKKAKKVKKSDVVERYKEINDQLEKKADALNDANKAMDRMYGASRLQQMQKQNAIIKDEIDLLKQKKAEALKYLKEDRQAVANAAKEAGVTLTLDENGLISNYTEAMTEIYNELDSAINSANANGNVSDSEQEKIDLIQKRADNLQDAIDQYDGTWAEIDDLDNQLDDKFYEWQDNNAETLSYKLELKLELNDMELEEIEYELSKIKDDFYSMAEAAALMSSSNGKSQLSVYTQELADYATQQKALENAYVAGEISQAAYVKGMKEVRSGIYDNLSSLQELDKSMIEYYGNTLDMAAEEIAKYTDRMDHQTAVLDHYSSLLEIMGKSNDYKTMGKTLEGRAKMFGDQASVAKKTMEMYKDSAADRLTEYQNALARGDQAAAELYLKEYDAALAAANEAEDVYLSKAEEWAEALKAVLENKLADLADTLEDALTGGTSFDSIATSMERASSLQEEYLTTTNKIYETNKMINTAQKEIDKTTNTVAKQRLKNFQQETSQLQNKSKLSQYELDIQQAKYDLLLAEIALEEAQQAKSTVRLRRDSEGNFGYVYTADTNAIADAEQKVSDAQNALYNKGLEGANNYVQKYQETMSEMYDTLKEIQEQYLNGEFATEEEYHRKMEEAKAYYYQKLQDYSSLYQVALTTDSRVVADAWSTDFADMVYSTKDWQMAVNDYVDQVEVAFDDWHTQIQTIATDTSLDILEENIKDIVDESEKLKDTIMGDDGVINAIEQEIDAVAEITSGYATLRKTLSELMGDYEALGKTIDKAVRKQQAAEMSTSSNNTTFNAQSVGGKGNSSGGKDGASTEQSKKPTKSPEKPMEPSLGFVTDRQETSFSRRVPISQVYYVENKIIENGGPLGNLYKVIYSDGKGYKEGYTTKAEYERVVRAKQQYDQDLKAYNKQIASMDTGGYTGSWGSEGKLAMLHQKELVLNPEDTTNFLASLEVLREIINVIDLHSMNAQLAGLLSSPYYNNNTEAQVLEQQVHIEATFPNVSDRNEIEEAFNNLVNRASQFVNRK